MGVGFCRPGRGLVATVPVVDKALTMMRLFLEEQMMLNFRDAEQRDAEEEKEERCLHGWKELK